MQKYNLFILDTTHVPTMKILFYITAFFTPALFSLFANAAETSAPLPLKDTTPPHRNLLLNKILRSFSLKNSIVCGAEVNPPFKYSYMVSLQTNETEHICGGVLIEPFYVLTSASDICRNVEYVYFGRHDLGDTVNEEEGGAEKIEVDSIHPHEDYSSVTNENDVMLIKLKTKPQNNNYTTIQLDDGSSSATRSLTSENLQVTVMGWGYGGTNEDIGDYNSNVLQEAIVSIVSNRNCEWLFYGQRFEAESMICAGGGTEFQDHCYGDTGGPLISKGSNNKYDDDTNDVLVGIISWGLGCRNWLPGVYTRVSHYYDWVQQTIMLISSSPTAYPSTSPSAYPTTTATPSDNSTTT